MLRYARVRAIGDPHASRISLGERLAGYADAPVDLRLDRGRIGVGIGGEPFQIAVHRAERGDVEGLVFLHQLDDFVVDHRPVLDRIRADPHRQLDPFRAVGMDRDLAAIGMRGIDQRAGFVLEHPGGQTGAGIDPPSGGKLDHVRPAPDLAAHRAAAIVRAVAQVFRANQAVDMVRHANAPVHVAAAGGNRFARIDNARGQHPAAPRRFLQRQHLAVAVTQVAHRGKARAQGLHPVPIGFVGVERQAVGDKGGDAVVARAVGREVRVAVDQAGQDRAGLQVDGLRAGRGGGIAILHRDDLAFVHHDGRRPARRLTRHRDYPARMDIRRRGERAGGRQQRGGEGDGGAKHE